MADLITEHTLISAAHEQVSGDLLEGEVVILNLKDGVYYGLNTIGGHIWQLIQEPKTASQIRDILLEEYDVTSEQCTEELLTLLNEMEAKGLIEVIHQSPS